MFKNLFNANRAYNLERMTITTNVAALVSFFFIDFNPQLFALTVFMYFLTFGLGISMTFHRTLTHSSMKMHPVLETIGKFFACMGGTGSPIGWVMIHRAHHKYSDTALDPHSAKDILNGLIGRYPAVSAKGLRQQAKSSFNKFMHRYYYLVLLSYGALWTLLGIDLFFYGFVYPMVLTMAAGNLVNWYTHSAFVFNYKLFETRDTSHNNVIIGILTWGEGLHNTHHRYPKRASFAVKPWEVDLTFLVARVLAKLKLVKF